MAAAQAYDLALADVLMRNNTAKNGGGVYISGCHDFVVYNTSMLNNNANISGGGIFQVSCFPPTSASQNAPFRFCF